MIVGGTQKLLAKVLNLKKKTSIIFFHVFILQNKLKLKTFNKNAGHCYDYEIAL